jgi:UDP-N-acetylmuramoyl-L-alanyl-D-glutamate--2,6-diaminopimelate ligase
MPHDRSLPALLDALPQLSPRPSEHGPDLDAPLSGITQDSRLVTAGAAFVAVPGFRVDGHAFLAQARAAGAALLVVQSDKREVWQPLVDDGAALLELPDTRVALPALAAAYHDFPARKLIVTGVTGTDGKTTTTYLLRSILEAADHPTGLIGGVQFKVGDGWRWNQITQTSPEADLMQALLAEMVEAGQTHVALEATSHGLALHRLDYCDFDVAVFTGLSDDHLDFHGTREAYLDSKLDLFRSLGDGGAGVVFADEPQLDAIAAASKAPLTRVSFENSGADVSLSDVQTSAVGSTFRVATPAGAYGTEIQLPARFNLRNALSAAGAAYVLGCPITAIADGLRAIDGVPGRMERIDAGQAFSVIVDAAATEAALRTVLEAVKPLVEGRLIVVFGCAGERDIARGEGMGRAAAQLADLSILTNENPRSADPVQLVATIARAMQSSGASEASEFEQQPERRAAIARAFELAQPADLVLIAGKGAEQTMIHADHIEPWDDRRIARELLA